MTCAQNIVKVFCHRQKRNIVLSVSILYIIVPCQRLASTCCYKATLERCLIVFLSTQDQADLLYDKLRCHFRCCNVFVAERLGGRGGDSGMETKTQNFKLKQVQTHHTCSDFRPLIKCGSHFSCSYFQDKQFISLHDALCVFFLSMLHFINSP